METSAPHSVAWPKPRLRPGLDVLLAAIAAAVVGALVTNHALHVATLVAGAVVVVMLGRTSWLPYVLVGATVATVAFYAGWPELMGIKIPELVLAAALLASAAHLGAAELRAPSAHTSLMALFLAATAGGVYVGVEHGASVDEALKGMRPIVFYAALWPALVVAADPRSRRLVLRFAAFAVPLLVGLQIAQVAVGLERPLFAFTSTVERVALTPQADGFLRVRSPALTLVYVATIFAAAYLLWGPRRDRLRAAAVFGAGAVGVLLSLNRNMIIGIVLGLAVAALVVPRRQRVLLASLMLSLLAVASLSLWQATPTARATQTVMERVLSIGDISALRSGTLSDRSYENRAAIRVLKDHPITGIGWGTPYGARLIEYRDGRVVNEARGFMHQQYLWMWLRTGLVGLFALLLLLAVALISAARWARRRAWDDQSWLGPAVLASSTAIAASANVGTYLTNPESIVVLTGVLALGYALRAELARGRETVATR
jgi:O-antigen ligase